MGFSLHLFWTMNIFFILLCCGLFMNCRHGNTSCLCFYKTKLRIGASCRAKQPWICISTIVQLPLKKKKHCQAVVDLPLSWRQQHQFTSEQPYLALVCKNTRFPIEFAYVHKRVTCQLTEPSLKECVNFLHEGKIESKMTVKTLLGLLCLWVLVAQISTATFTSLGELRNNEHKFLAARLMCLKSIIYTSPFYCYKYYNSSFYFVPEKCLWEFSSSILPAAKESIQPFHQLPSEEVFLVIRFQN